MIGNDISVDGGQILPSTITTDKIVTVDATQIEGEIGTLGLQDLSVTSAKLADQAVISTKLASGAVITDKLGSSAVTTIKIAD